MEHVVKLRTITTTEDANGFMVPSATTVNVFADKLSVRQSEYYAADAKGKQLDMVLRINADDWGEQEEVEFNGVIYEIVRAYQKGLGRIELTCAKKVP